jgi:glycosyltransferase involved in cell wall biosynthesis
MRDPLVSVVMNNYNYAEYVGQAIESVLGQEEAQFECIVVDHGSTDGSQAVIDGYSDVKHVNKCNGDQFSAVRFAFPHTKGDIVVFWIHGGRGLEQ